MKKNELVALVAEQTGLSKKDMEKTVDVLLSAIVDALAAGDKVQMSGFGSFEPRVRAARTGHDPRTGEKIVIPQAVVPVFKPSKNLKDKVEGK